jgi:hypothetical protein
MFRQGCSNESSIYKYIQRLAPRTPELSPRKGVSVSNLRPSQSKGEIYDMLESFQPRMEKASAMLLLQIDHGTGDFLHPLPLS